MPTGLQPPDVWATASMASRSPSLTSSNIRRSEPLRRGRGSGTAGSDAGSRSPARRSQSRHSNHLFLRDGTITAVPAIDDGKQFGQPSGSSACPSTPPSLQTVAGPPATAATRTSRSVPIAMTLPIPAAARWRYGWLQHPPLAFCSERGRLGVVAVSDTGGGALRRASSSMASGAAANMEEYVSTSMPISKARAKSLSEFHPARQTPPG